MESRVDSQEYARRLVLSPDDLKAEIDALRNAGPAQDAIGPTAIGVSVIMPTYQGAGRIAVALESLASQSLDRSRYEVIVVPNGEDDGTLALLASLGPELDMDLRVLRSSRASAGEARNLGLAAARMSHVTFVDDDDTVEPRFLEELMLAVEGGDIALAPIVNVTPDGDIDPNNSLGTRIDALLGKRVLAREIPWALGFNACKLVPIELARKASYRPDLRSGEDLVYFAHLLTEPGIHITAVRPGPDRAYLRQLRDDSISRRTGTFEFLVEERLECIKDLEATQRAASKQDAAAITQLIKAQQGFIARYAEANEGGRDEILRRVPTEDHRHLPWAKLNSGLARDLAIAYCFMPFSDTSGVVAGKAIAERERIVDVISNDMSKIRRVDESLRMLSDPWVDQHVVVQAPPSFADWSNISDFATKALDKAEKLDATKGPYETMYSRALWAGSHVAAALFKLRHWNVVWTAEFSDPLRRDAAGLPRKAALVDNDVSERLRQGIAGKGFAHLPIESSFDLIEAVTMVLADDLLFTNQNQLDYMLSLYKDQDFKAMVLKKARVRPHPTPAPELYHVSPTSYEVPDGVVNIAYFGSFYPNRGIGEVMTALQNSSPDVRRKVRFHIFCNNPKLVKEQIAEQHLSANVYVNPYLDYLEFLNAATLFDVLLVNDVVRDDNLPINPFLPSKVSDYLGSGRKIWALTDEGSPMSHLAIAEFTSPAGNSSAIHQDLATVSETE